MHSFVVVRCGRSHGYGLAQSLKPAHHLLADHILVRTQISLVAVGQWQVGDIADPYLISLRGLGLVEWLVGGAAQPVRRIGSARGKGLGLQRVQTSAAHGPAQALPPDAIAFAA